MKIVFEEHDKRALAFVVIAVPGATPKKPFSGLIALSWPVESGLIQAISSPTVVTFHPLSCKACGGMIIAKFVFPQALGNAAVTYVFCFSGFSTPRISICSASHPSSFASFEPIRSAKHFFPRRAS